MMETRKCPGRCFQFLQKVSDFGVKKNWQTKGKVIFQNKSRETSPQRDKLLCDTETIHANSVNSSGTGLADFPPTFWCQFAHL